MNAAPPLVAIQRSGRDGHGSTALRSGSAQSICSRPLPLMLRRPLLSSRCCITSSGTFITPGETAARRHRCSSRLLRFQLSNGIVSLAGNLVLMRLLVDHTRLPLLVANTRRGAVLLRAQLLPGRRLDLCRRQRLSDGKTERQEPGFSIGTVSNHLTLFRRSADEECRSDAALPCRFARANISRSWSPTFEVTEPPTDPAPSALAAPVGRHPLRARRAPTVQRTPVGGQRSGRAASGAAPAPWSHGEITQGLLLVLTLAGAVLNLTGCSGGWGEAAPTMRSRHRGQLRERWR